ncbi:MAG: SoxR reducing system RseC family protein [Anaerosomatales bacterium]|nr:SoxR reducing system RseC family protein [Anaerosomatales bacterium]MDT8434821.1 SoxR reducing system RseC family protein [Anaerosomatales bacterium]
MRECGTVVSAADGRVSVAIVPSESCATCGACAEGAGGKRLLESIVDTHGARPGDTVEVETPAAARRRAQRLVYVVPVAAVVLGYLAGFLLANWVQLAPDVAGAVLAISAGAASLVSLRRYERSFEGAEVQARVRAIIARGRSRFPGDSGED